MSQRPGFPAKLPAAGATRTTRSPVVGLAKPSLAAHGLQPARALAAPAVAATAVDSGPLRARMVSKLAAQGLQDPMVLQAMGTVERHRFVETALAVQAYEDTSLPIGLGQTISKPNVVARMIELMREGVSGKLGRILEIGTGCGYQAAVLSHVSREVYSIERLRGLHEKARENLRPFRLSNVHLLFGDGMVGYAQGAPYAAIIAAAGGDAIPQAWIDQLAVGGRLVAPTVNASGRQNLVVVDKTATGVLRSELEAVHFVPLKSGIA